VHTVCYFSQVLSEAKGMERKISNKPVSKKLKVASLSSVGSKKAEALADELDYLLLESPVDFSSLARELQENAECLGHLWGTHVALAGRVAQVLVDASVPLNDEFLRCVRLLCPEGVSERLLQKVLECEEEAEWKETMDLLVAHLDLTPQEAALVTEKAIELGDAELLLAVAVRYPELIRQHCGFEQLVERWTESLTLDGATVLMTVAHDHLVTVTLLSQRGMVHSCGQLIRQMPEESVPWGLLVNLTEWSALARQQSREEGLVQLALEELNGEAGPQLQRVVFLAFCCLHHESNTALVHSELRPRGGLAVLEASVRELLGQETCSSAFEELLGYLAEQSRLRQHSP
jgi:hypothetical protein